MTDLVINEKCIANIVNILKETRKNMYNFQTTSEECSEECSDNSFLKIINNNNDILNDEKKFNEYLREVNDMVLRDEKIEDDSDEEIEDDSDEEIVAKK